MMRDLEECGMARIRSVGAVLAGILLCLALSTALAQGGPEVLRLGLLTAADSQAGRGTQLAMAEINSLGGVTGPDGTVYSLELLSVPAESAEQVRAGLEALQEREVLVVLGPDDTSLALASFNVLRSAGLPVLTAATGDALTIADTADVIFRSRAPEQTYVNAMAAFVAAQPGNPGVATADLGPAVTGGRLLDLPAALREAGVTPLSSFQLNDPANLATLAADTLALNPDIFVVWGEVEAAVELLASLRSGGWEGGYFYRDAANPAFRSAVREGLGPAAGQIWGVNNWVPGVRNFVSDDFLQRYVVTFGEVPDELSAAYYDAVYLIAGAIEAHGADPGDVRRGLQTLEEYEGVQGIFSPAQFVIGETINAAVLFELNLYAAPQVQSLFVDGALRQNTGGEPGGELVRVTPVPGTPTATPTITPTPTPEGVYAIVTTYRLNVRTGPGMDYDVIGQYKVDDVLRPVGASADFSWLVVPFRGTTGWVAAYLVDLHGDLNTLPVVAPPPTPTPAPTATSTISPFADLVIDAAAVEPARPVSGQPFTVRATVRNAGNVPSVDTALAATFQPGDVYVSTAVPALAPGQAIQVMVTPTVTGSGLHTVQLVLDLNNLVNEGPEGEANNLYPVTYELDHGLLRTGTMLINPGQQHDLMGAGTTNLGWDGSALTGLNGAQIAVLPGLNWMALQYEQLTGIVGAFIPRASLPSGTVVGLITAPEGYRGALRIDGYVGDAVQYTYRIYAP